MDRRKG